MNDSTCIDVGGITVDFSASTIDGPTSANSIEPKVMDLLQVLVSNAGNVVSREALLDEVWADTYGGDESLTRAVSLLRKAFGQTRGGAQYIETVPKRGYRLVAPVRAVVERAGIDDAAVSIDSQVGINESPVASDKASTASNQGLWIALFAIAAIIAAIFWYSPTNTSSMSTSIKSAALSTSIAEKSIAILPFKDLSSKGNQQYLADGVAEEVLNALVRFNDLRVIGRASSFAFREQNPNLAQIRSTLSVAHVLVGSLRKQGAQVRVTASLVQTSDGTTLWSANYNDDLDSIFGLQEDIAREITKNLGVVLDLGSQQSLMPKLTSNRDAYILFVQGRALARKFDANSKLKAKQLLSQAVALDPNFAAAWAWLGQTQLFLTLAAYKSEAPKLLAQARASTQRALALDSELPMGHYVNSILSAYELDLAAAIKQRKQAYELNASQPFLMIRLGRLYANTGNTKRGLQLMEAGLDLDPTDAIGLVNLGTAYASQGDLQKAEELYNRASDLGVHITPLLHCNIVRQLSGANAAIACWQQLPVDIRQRYIPALRSDAMWHTLARAMYGQDTAANQAVIATLDDYFANPSVSSSTYNLLAYLSAGAPERYMQYFVERPYPLNSAGLGLVWWNDQAGQALRQHPDFNAFAERIGLVAAWQQYGWPDKCQAIAGSDGSDGQFSCE